LWTLQAVADWLGSPLRNHCSRILLELPNSPDESPTFRLADQMIDQLAVASTRQPVLLHGEGASAWPVLRFAFSRGLETRIGLQDTLYLQDGRIAQDNAVLVAQALRWEPTKKPPTGPRLRADDRSGDRLRTSNMHLDPAGEGCGIMS
jgi:hypothetical protein